MTTEGRFWAKVQPEPNTGCWLWSAAAFADGYPALGVDSGMVRAHRWAYEHFVGPIPAGSLVCHRCDTPSCVNPDHLFVGTNSDNVGDMWSKGRGVAPDSVGMKNGRARLTRSDVLAIRAEFDRGVPRGWKRRTADRYGVQEAAIGKITRRESWKHL